MDVVLPIHYYSDDHVLSQLSYESQQHGDNNFVAILGNVTSIFKWFALRDMFQLAGNEIFGWQPSLLPC